MCILVNFTAGAEHVEGISLSKYKASGKFYLHASASVKFAKTKVYITCISLVTGSRIASQRGRR